MSNHKDWLEALTIGRDNASKTEREARALGDERTASYWNGVADAYRNILTAWRSRSSNDQTEKCSECSHTVHRCDPYFATPCGTFCSDCMETKHGKECGICASEFELNDDDEV